MPEKPIALIVGASRGLGLALAESWCGKGWHVIATQRAPSEGLQDLASRYPDSLEIEHVDTNESDAVHALRQRLDGRTLKILFVNAGIMRAVEDTPATAAESDFLDLMLTNALSPVRAVEVLQDLVVADGAIVVMSSGLGSIAGNNGAWTLYSSSKAALNMLMKGFAAPRSDDMRAILLMAPGWVRTDMGGAGATYSIEESIPLVVETVEAACGIPGLRFIDRFGKQLPW